MATDVVSWFQTAAQVRVVIVQFCIAALFPQTLEGLEQESLPCQIRFEFKKKVESFLARSFRCLFPV